MVFICYEKEDPIVFILILYLKLKFQDIEK